MPRICKVLSSLLVVGLVGCTSSPKIELPDPKDVPREKWSDAMLYLEAMGIEGMRDVPREMTESVPSQSLQGSASPNVLDATSVGVGALSPAGGMSGGAALGIGFGLMLLGSGPVQPVQVVQIAAWVPSDLASSPKEAVRIVEEKFNEAREKAFVKKLPQNISMTTYPVASGLSYNKKFPKKENLVLFSSEAKESPDFISAPSSYGPIFIHGHEVSLEANHNASGTFRASFSFYRPPMEKARDNMVAFSAALPEWFVIYDTAKAFSKTDRLPPVVLRGGEANYFIGK